MKKYKIIGVYARKKINRTEIASSKKQAKLKSAFNEGVSGNDIQKYMKSTKVKVRKA